MIDQNGYGCIIAGREKQFQCDLNKAPYLGWNVGFDGIITFQGSASFFGCATGDHGGYNLYLEQLQGDYCEQVTLVATGACYKSKGRFVSSPLSTTKQGDYAASYGGGLESGKSDSYYAPTAYATPRPECAAGSACNCKGTCTCSGSSQCSGASKTHNASTVSGSVHVSGSSSGSASSSQLTTLKCPGPDCVGHLKDTCHGKAECYKTWVCPAVLKGAWQFPHLLVPVSSRNPDYAPGTQYFGIASTTTRSYFNFDIPEDYKGKECTARFMLPAKDQLETSDFTLKGSGNVSAGWTSEISQSVSWNTAPKCANPKSFQLQPGHSYIVGKAQCKPGVMGFMLEGAVDTYLHWFQDYNPCPIGLYLTAE
ncbi:Ubiquitin 3 binding protein But2 [Macrophomina phaseolina MS6]|uniref:Ubiquitin 3 binding protein But2 n=1 Tax=Macrophomina phaseolina (strain MS6) TaxID=1126212 RepID=K2QZE1_MACPH|nr:Ubiquitin 3 binding protein But2 [Macrophomina phaseolina MS6]